MTDTETQPAETPTPTPATPPTDESSSPLVDHLVERRPDVRKRLLVWSGIFVVVFVLFLLVASIPELRRFDPVFLPSLFFLVGVALVYGYVVGMAHGLRYCLKWSREKLRRD